MDNVFISLGSNTRDKMDRLREAVRAIGCIRDLAITGASSVYLTEPQDYRNQDWFANQVLRLATGPSWSAPKLLASLLQLEATLGRKRAGAIRFGPRAMDIDLLLFGDATCKAEHCLIPHPRMLNRAFVLAPLMEIDPNMSIGAESLKTALERLDYRIVGNRIYQS